MGHPEIYLNLQHPCGCAVRFGKYTPMRSKDKKVHILINGEHVLSHAISTAIALV